MTCPECGSFSLHPHCRRLGCAGRWCARAECGWTSEVICSSPSMTLPPYPERVEGRRQFRQVVQTGTFRKSFIGGWQFADGWIFKTGGVDWNPNELYGFLVDTLETIRALEGPATW